MNEKALFTSGLHKFLLSEGYKYILYKGIEFNHEKVAGEDQDDYILIPTKENLNAKFQEADIHIERIESLDVLDMLEYTLGIDFWVELPKEVLERFKMLNNE